MSETPPPVLRPASRVLIAGTGALACAIGGRLARAGAAVTLTGTWREALDAVAARGIMVHEAKGGAQTLTWSAPAATVALDRLDERFPLALVLVKSQSTPAVAAALSRGLSPAGLAATLQNGLGNDTVLAARLGVGRVAAGVALMGARVLAPGEVRFIPGRVVLGVTPATAARVAELAALLCRAGIPAETTAEAEVAVWRKLVVNCAVNPLSALHGVRNGALLEDAALSAELVAAAREVAAVAAAKGLELGADPAELVLELVRATAGNRSSMLQDLTRGARTEIDFLNGAVLREAARFGIATPVVESLFRRVRERERRPLTTEERR